MDPVFSWLVLTEAALAEVYSLAAEAVADDPELAAFAARLAADERGHQRFLLQMAQGGQAPGEAKISSREEMAAIDAIIGRLRQLIASPGFCRQKLLALLVELEFSELNDIFLATVQAASETSGQFRKAAAEIQEHIDCIELFLSSRPDTAPLLDTVRRMPRIWRENILVVEDEPVVARLLQSVLRAEGNVEIAANGREGLEKLGRKYYRVIVSDIDMPEMDGISFYTRVADHYPGIGRRFLFFTGGDLSAERLGFLQEHSLRYLLKPAPIQSIRAAVGAITHDASAPSVRPH